MKTLLLAGALLGVTACAPGPAAAGFSFSISQPGFDLFVSDGPVYYGPPAYYAPPVFYAPPPTVHVIHRHPVYYAPRAVHRHHGRDHFHRGRRGRGHR
jgi:hypothetical protein